MASDDPNEEARRESTLVMGKVRSAQGLMREKGYTEQQIQNEQQEMKEDALGGGSNVVLQ